MERPKIINLNAEREKRSESNSFENIFKKLNDLKGYVISEVSGHSPEDGIYRFQLLIPINESSAPENAMAADYEEAEEYASAIRSALAGLPDKYHVTVNTHPSVSISIEKMST